ncbi:MAG: hypothetical protein MRJ52_02600 [Nitrosomonas sp.]|nr:hypothetical protein [Nitrosomonas sp.]
MAYSLLQRTVSRFVESAGNPGNDGIAHLRHADQCIPGYRRIGDFFQIVLYLTPIPTTTDDTVTSEFTTLMNDVFGDPSSDPSTGHAQLARGEYQVTDGLIDDIMQMILTIF